MDRSYDGAYGRISNTPSARMLEGRPSFEPTSPRVAAPPMPLQQPASRLQKKQSNAGVRNTTPGAIASSNLVGTTSPPTGTLALGGKTRTGSIRTAMRKIFGKKPKEVEPKPIRTSPPRHQYHRSESSALPPPIEIPETETYPSGSSQGQRTFSSDSYQLVSPYASKRTGSPYAVQFPKSAQLKPLDLGNPFAAPSAQLRRRKTLPTILPAELGKPDSTVPLLAPLSSHPPPVPPVPRELRPTITDPDRFAKRERSPRRSKRRSRSVEDLKRSTDERSIAPRKRSEEIQYWRDSVQGDARHASSLVGIIPIGAAIGELEEENTPLARPDPFDETRISPIIHDSPQRLSLLPVSEPEPSTPGTDFTKDLEDRVARLEAGLRTFQRSLQRLTADRNRRTVIMGNMPVRRSSDEFRTPSMLADTLLDLPDPPASPSFAPTPLPPRPSTSPRPSISRPADDPFIPDPPTHYSPQIRPLRASASPTTSRPQSGPRARSPSTPTDQRLPPTTYTPSSHPTPPSPPLPLPSQPYTFHSLYQMLADERSARHRLESEMRHLRDELSDLHSQVALSSTSPSPAVPGSTTHIPSQRSSYLPTDPSAGSTRIRELLRETETLPSPLRSSPPARTTTPPPPREIGSSRGEIGVASTTGVAVTPSRWPQRVSGIVTSRFSGSEEEESEGEDREEGELETPLEAYQTPAEEQSRWDLGREEVF